MSYSLSQEILITETSQSLHKLGFIDMAADFMDHTRVICIADIEKARCDCSYEEFSSEDYEESLRVINHYFNEIVK